jgi:hypothetical protein
VAGMGRAGRFERRDSPWALREGIHGGRAGGRAGGVCGGSRQAYCGEQLATGGGHGGRAGREGDSQGVIRCGRCGREFAAGGRLFGGGSLQYRLNS